MTSIFHLGSEEAKRSDNGAVFRLATPLSKPDKALGWDHFECRGWGCVHRHLIVTIVTQLFCARVRHRLCPEEIVTDAQRLTLEQVRRTADVFVRCVDFPPRIRECEYKAELERIRYHQTRNAQASRSHRKKRMAIYHAMGINPEKIKSINPKTPPQ